MKAEKEKKKQEALAALAWSDQQQTQLEAGMKQFGKELGPKARWIAVAKLVEGKEPKECFERFKELCAKTKK